MELEYIIVNLRGLDYPIFVIKFCVAFLYLFQFPLRLSRNSILRQFNFDTQFKFPSHNYLSPSLWPYFQFDHFEYIDRIFICKSNKLLLDKIKCLFERMPEL